MATKSKSKTTTSDAIDLAMDAIDQVGAPTGIVFPDEPTQVVVSASNPWHFLVAFRQAVLAGNFVHPDDMISLTPTFCYAEVRKAEVTA